MLSKVCLLWPCCYRFVRNVQIFTNQNVTPFFTPQLFRWKIKAKFNEKFQKMTSDSRDYKLLSCRKQNGFGKFKHFFPGPGCVLQCTVLSVCCFADSFPAGVLQHCVLDDGPASRRWQVLPLPVSGSSDITGGSGSGAADRIRLHLAPGQSNALSH